MPGVRMRRRTARYKPILNVPPTVASEFDDDLLQESWQVWQLSSSSGVPMALPRMNIGTLQYWCPHSFTISAWRGCRPDLDICPAASPLCCCRYGACCPSATSTGG